MLWSSAASNTPAMSPKSTARICSCVRYGRSSATPLLPAGTRWSRSERASRDFSATCTCTYNPAPSLAGMIATFAHQPVGWQARRRLYCQNRRSSTVLTAFPGGSMVVVESSLPAADVSGRGRILREARMLFTAQGYASVSMQLIADAAAVNKATLYHHFRDKEDLFVAVMAGEFARMAAGVEGVLAEGGCLRDQLVRVAGYVFASHRSDFGRLAADLHEHVSERRRAELMTRCAPPWEHIRVAIDLAVE